MRFERERVLRFARDLVLARDILGGDAHMDRLERVVQRAEHHVDETRIAHALTKARSRHGIRCAAHVFRATGDCDIGVAEQHALRGRNDSLQARAAQTVDGQRRRMLRDAAVDRRYAGHIHVFRFGMHNAAEHHMTDIVTRHVRARQHFTHDACGEICRRKILQTAAKIADCRTHTADNHYLFRCITHRLAPVH